MTTNYDLSRTDDPGVPRREDLSPSWEDSGAPKVHSWAEYLNTLIEADDLASAPAAAQFLGYDGSQMVWAAIAQAHLPADLTARLLADGGASGFVMRRNAAGDGWEVAAISVDQIPTLPFSKIGGSLPASRIAALFSTAPPQPIGTNLAPMVGDSDGAARGDHAHALALTPRQDGVFQAFEGTGWQTVGAINEIGVLRGTSANRPTISVQAGVVTPFFVESVQIANQWAVVRLLTTADRALYRLAVGDSAYYALDGSDWTAIGVGTAGANANYTYYARQISAAAGTVISVQKLDKVRGDPAIFEGGGGPTSGLTRSQVDSRIAALVSDWAEAANADEIPDAKIREGYVDGRVQAVKFPGPPMPLIEASDDNALIGSYDPAENRWSDGQHKHGMTEHQQFVFNAFKGGQWDNRAETLITRLRYAARPSIGALTALSESDWVVASTGATGTRQENQWWGFRVPKSVVGRRSDLYAFWRSYILVTDDTDIPEPFAEEDYLGDDSEYWYLAQQYANKPAGDSVYIQSRVRYALDGEIVAAVQDGEITPPKLAGNLPPNTIPQVSADGTTFVRAPGGAHLTTFLDAVRINPDRTIQETNNVNGYRSALLAVSGFDLDDHMAGQVTVEALWHIVSTTGEGDTEIAFTEAGAMADDYETYEGTLATTIANSAAFVTATPANEAQGVHVGTFMLWRGNDQLGTGRLYLTRDGDNAVSGFWQYVGSAGNYSATIRCTLTVSITENDGGVAGGAVSGIVSVTQSQYDALAVKDAATLYLITG